MDKLSEEEIIEEFKELIYNPDYDEILLCTEDGFTRWHELFKNILDLYQKEKEKNKELEEMLKHRIKYTNELEKDLFENASNYVIPKSKVREIFENYSQSSLMENNTFLEFKKELLEERN